MKDFAAIASIVIYGLVRSHSISGEPIFRDFKF